MTFTAPDIDYAGLSPVIALTAGICVVLIAGVFTDARQRVVASALSLLTLATAAGLCIWQWGEQVDLVAGALRLDELGLAVALIAIASAAFVIPLAWREEAFDGEAGPGGQAEFQALVLSSVLGMVLLAQAQNLVVFFVALELLSVPLYVLCGAARRRSESLESGLKYLIVGSLGSATLLYGLAFIYGGSGATDFAAISEAIGSGLADDPLVLIGIALSATGLAFKLSVAPFHQWTPDVYQGAPTPVTAFMAVATKAAAFAVLVRFFEVALGPTAADWRPALAALALVSIVVGNVGALGQASLKRLLGYSGVAQAGYMLVGVVAFSEAGVNALVFYLAAYALMNLAAFAVITMRERQSPYGDDIRSVEGLAGERPALAISLTVAMLALAGLPGTAGFIGKLFLIEAAVEGDYTWLGVAIAVGTMISLAYYLRVVAAVWMRPGTEDEGATGRAGPMPAMAGGSQEADAAAGVRCRTIVALTVLAAGATVFFGVLPSPLVEWASEAGVSLAGAFPLIMEGQEALEVYREGIAAWSRGDRDWVLARATDDFEFHAAQLFPGIQAVYKGREGLKDFWSEFISDPWSELEIEVERSELLPDGRVIALLRFRGVGKGSGAEVTVHYAHIAEFRDGDLARVDGFRDWDEALAAAGGAPGPGEGAAQE